MEKKELTRKSFYLLSELLVQLICIIEDSGECEETVIIDKFLHEIYPFMPKYYMKYLDMTKEELLKKYDEMTKDS